MNRIKIIAGNWKMNTTIEDGISLATALASRHSTLDPQMILIPPYTHLMTIKGVLEGSALFIGAQNCHQEVKGAFTGEISAAMLSTCGIPYVILGHSERRQYFFETDTLLAKKVVAALTQNLIPIFCVGEALEIRNLGDQNNFVLNQLQAGLFHLSPEDFSKVIIAYEPIWAIGTGATSAGYA
jgi:triosephosphate isomerase (TIM)